MPDMKFERKRVWIHGDKVIVISQVTANITGRPKGQKEVPLFPGIPAEKLMNKEFKTVALDIHKIVDGKIKQSYHIEDCILLLSKCSMRRNLHALAFTLTSQLPCSQTHQDLL